MHGVKKIVYVTGSRAEYGRMRSTLHLIEKQSSLKLSLIVTGMHLSQEFGYTIREIEKDGFKIDSKIQALPLHDTGAAMAEALARCITGITKILRKKKHDFILVLGDRGEMLAASIAGAHMNIPVIHVGGGYVSGSIDDRLRDAITIFSDIHFTPNKKSAERVIALGAKPSSVYVVGAPDLDAIRNKEFAKPKEIARKFHLDLTKSIILVSQHPVTTEVEESGDQMRETMEAVVEMGMQTIVINPNADAGGRRMLRVINESKNVPFVQIYRNVPYASHLGLMNVADVMVGNSSAGIIEAPSFGLPVVNIGTRQEGRERAENVIDVGYDRKEIIVALKRALTPEFKRIAKSCKNPYGDGKTGEKIVNILAKIVRVETQ